MDPTKSMNVDEIKAMFKNNYMDPKVIWLPSIKILY